MFRAAGVDVFTLHPPFLPPIAASAEKELRLNSYDVVSSHLIPSCSLLVRQDQSDYGR